MTQKIPVTSQFVRQNNADFPIVEDVDTRGGLRVVQDEVERNNIPSSMLKLGMLVIVQTPEIQSFRLTQVSPPVWVTGGTSGVTEYDSFGSFPPPATAPGTFAWAQDTNLLYAALEGVWELVGGVGISPVTIASHQTLRQLIHFVDDGPGFGFPSGAFKEILPPGDPFPTSKIWWESSAKLRKIVQQTIVRNANQTPATITWEAFSDVDGATVVETLIDTYTYSGAFVISKTRTIS